jgi:hypothetical protein
MIISELLSLNNFLLLFIFSNSRIDFLTFKNVENEDFFEPDALDLLNKIL